MDNKRAALKEFSEVLLKKYGRTEQTQSFIKAELKKFKEKSRICVSDLDSFESSVKNSKFLRLSPVSPESNIYSTYNQARLTPKPNFSRENTENFLLKGTVKHTGKKKVFKMPDNPIFPLENVTHYESISNPWKNYSNFSPHSPVLEHIDVWGKIHKADFIKFQSENKRKQQKSQLEQLEYKEFLEKQIREQRKFAEIDQTPVFLPQNRFAKHREVQFIKKNLDEMVLNNYEKRKKESLNKTQEETQMVKQWELEKRQEKLKFLEKIRGKHEVDLENTLQMRKARIKRLEERSDSVRKSRELLKERISQLDSTEISKKNLINARISFVHNENRLKQLLPVPEKRSHSDFSNATSLIIGKSRVRNKEKEKNYCEELKRQIQEKNKKDLKNQELAMEQSEIWKEAEKKALEEDKNNKKAKKELQRKRREELERQVSQRMQREINEIMFTDHEAKVNKQIFEASLSILEKKSFFP